MEGMSKTLGSGAGQVILPLLMGAASVFAPRVASGIGGGLQLATHMGELNRRREQAGTLRDYLASQGNMGIDPTKVPDELLGGVLGHQIEQNQPRQWPTTIGEQHGIITSPKVGGTPTFTPVGPEAPPTWDQAHKTKAWMMFKTTNPTPEQMGQIDEAIKQEELAKEQRNIQTWYEKQGPLLEKSYSLQERSFANQQLLQEQAYQRRITEADISKGKDEYKQLNSGYRKEMTDLDKEYQKQLGSFYSNGQPLLPADKLKAKKQELSQQYLQKQGNIRDDYLNKYQDWEETYKHVRQYLPGAGGMPRVIQRIRGGQKQQQTGGDRPWLNME